MVIILMGVSGVGKTTVGLQLAHDLGWAFYDGDDFHPPENVAKMSRGIPLTDEDRWPWLEKLGRLIHKTNREKGKAILACSALKQKYRDKITLGNDQVSIIYLKGSYELIQVRLYARRGHYMDPELLKSQFETLEEPDDALCADVSSSPEAIARTIRESLGL